MEPTSAPALGHGIAGTQAADQRHNGQQNEDQRRQLCVHGDGERGFASWRQSPRPGKACKNLHPGVLDTDEMNRPGFLPTSFPEFNVGALGSALLLMRRTSQPVYTSETSTVSVRHILGAFLSGPSQANHAKPESATRSPRWRQRDQFARCECPRQRGECRLERSL